MNFRELPERPCGPLSEAMLYAETDKCPRSGYSYLRFHGRVDHELLREAARRTQYAYPSLASRFAERRVGLRRLIMRIPVAEPLPLKVVEATNADGREPGQILQDYFEPYYTCRLGVFEGATAQFFLFCFSDDEHALVSYNHHTAADGSTTMGFMRTLFAHYHELVKGEPPEWKEAEDLASSARTAQKFPIWPVLREMRAEARRRREHPLIRFGRDVRPTCAARDILGFNLSEDETRAMVKKSKALDATVNDLLSVEAIRSLDSVLGAPDGTISFWIPANVRTSPEDLSHANYSSAVNVDLIRAERVDEARLLGLFVERRRALFASGRPYVNLRLLRSLLSVVHFIPYRWRRSWMNKLMAQPTTFMSSNLGVLWPKRVNGKMTPYSVLTHAGGLELIEYGYNFSTDENIGHGLISHTFNGRFSAWLSVNRQVVDRDLAERFMNALKERLIS
jgi:hypothetical protein